MSSTFLDIQVPEWATDFHQCVGDTLEIGKGDPAYFEGHLRGARGQRTH